MSNFFHWGMGDWEAQIRETLNSGVDMAPDLREEHLATLELFERGIDPRHPRQFRGAVALKIRCQPKGHVLGQIYSTSHGPLFFAAVLQGGGRQVLADGAITDGKRDIWGIGPILMEGTHSESFMVPMRPERLFPPGSPPTTLMCRCGERQVDPDQVQDALRSGHQMLLV